MKRLTDSKGFTILEVMVATMITGALVVLIMTFMVNAVADNITATAKADMLREAQLTLDSVGREIRLSANADENNRWEDANAPDPDDDFSWESDADTLVLATAAINSSGNILFSDPLHYVSNKNNNIYYVSNGTLYKRTLADPVAGNTATTSCPVNASDSCPDDRVLVHNVQSFQVRYFDNQNVEIEPSEARSVELTLTMQRVRYGKAIDASFTTRTVFRNE